jgi:hypothetical protein
MADQTEDIADAVPPTTPRRRRILRRSLAGMGLAILAALLLAWFQREEIADDLIQDQLDQLGLEATYEIESIGRRQVLVNVVVGDPAHPDLTIERVETSLVPRWPFPALGRVRVVKPRLYGTYVDGKLSFGALDKLLFEQPPSEKFEIPDIDLILDDGRALIEGDHGAVGIKLAGQGNLRDGFSGIVAATAPRLQYGGCSANGASIYGKIAMEDQRPGFDGPLRLGALACPELDLAANRLVLALDTRLGTALGETPPAVEGAANLTGGRLAYAGNSAQALNGSFRFAWRENGFASSYDLGLERVQTPQFAAATLGLEGSVRSRGGLARIELEADAEGTGLRPGPMIDEALAGAASASAYTLAQPIFEQIRSSLAREGRDSTLGASFTLRRTGQVTSVVVPEGRWVGTSGETMLALSRFQLTLGGAGQPRFSGNFTTGGRGLPRISGRMESRDGRDTQFRLRMAEYRAANASLELPELVVTQSPRGFGFSGEVLASGPLPGGRIARLALPIEGSWSSAGALALWNGCVPIGFDRLELASIALAKRQLRLCPAGSGPVFRQDARGSVLAGVIPDLDLSGTVGSSPISVRAASLALNYPGETAANEVEVLLGAAEAPSRFVIGRMTLNLQDGIGGRFERADTYLGAVPESGSKTPASPCRTGQCPLASLRSLRAKGG